MARLKLKGVRSGTDEPKTIYWDQVRVVEVDVIGTDDVFYARITKPEARQLLEQGQRQLEARIEGALPRYSVVIGHRI